ncbi:uncharacterized protein LOC126770569 [Nymphalis io]|uniref:uncharacterized protein LOC126770569 n=1 Tax=Inachis io TaxID=171585 RepID=UPI0021670337|nr:uncharacterized protein LOC126770569 [Nymphalis io]
MNHAWYSKKDVTQDLTTATGKSVCDLKEEYVVEGQKPPPYHLADEVEEEMQISTLGGGQKPSGNIDIGKPDLMGITQMIRMVDQFYEKPLIKNKPDDDNRLVTNTVISISKLNPDVEEFVPRNYANKPPNNLNVVGVRCIQEDIIEKNDETVKCDKSEKGEKTEKRVEQLRNPKSLNNIKEINKIDNCYSNSLGRIDVSRLSPLEMEEMRKKLKTKISGTSNTNCVKVKRERNLAIATLVKLHCKPPNAAVSGEEKFELKTPDYYQKSLEKDSKIESIKKSNILSDAALDNSVVITKQLEYNENLELTIGSNTKQLCAVNETNTTFKVLDDDKNTQKRPSQSLTSTTKENSCVITKEVRESIVKVENWFNSPSKKQKGPSFYLGPVTFKRKVCSKPMSPISIGSENSNAQKSEIFVPSEFANQLSKKYMERSKAREADEQDIWMKIESELKAKDKK